MISLIIPTYNRAGLVERCVATAIKDREDLEVIWIDDASTDGTQENLKVFNPEITILKKKNDGLAKTFNQGLKVAGGDWVCRMGSDLEMPENWLKVVKEHIEKIPETDVMCIPIDGFQKDWVGEEIQIKGVDVYTAKKIMGFFVVSKKFLERVGYYNEEWGWYTPIDMEWSNRAMKLNPITYYIKGLQIKHLGVGEWDDGEYRERKNKSLKTWYDNNKI